MGSFSDKVKGFGKISLESSADVYINAGSELFREFIKKSPVGNPDDWNISESEKNRIKESGYIGGQLKNDWRFKVDGEIKENRSNPEKNGNESIKEAMSALSEASKKITSGKDVFIQANNNQPYANRIEFLGWSKLKAPKGMVINSIKKIGAKVRAGGIK